MVPTPWFYCFRTEKRFLLLNVRLCRFLPVLLPKILYKLDLISTYFPKLSETQQAHLGQLPALYTDWNTRINVVSRQDIENLTERHILHSLAIAAFFQFNEGSNILDLGTGGGFPGIPLAIVFPEVQFTLIDGTGKKIKVVQEIAEALGLQNVTAKHLRAEEVTPKSGFDFVVTRAVAALPQLLQWAQPLLSRRHQNAYPNGILALKGGDIKAELKLLPGKANDYTEVFPIHEKFDRPFFEEKWIVYVQG